MSHLPSSVLATLLAGALAHGPATVSGATGSMASLRAAIGDAACTLDDQCRTIAIGSKACGGPEAYLAWSTLRSDEGTLREAAEAYARVQQDTPPGRRISNCLFVTDPGAACRPSASGHSCQLLKGGSAPTQ